MWRWRVVSLGVLIPVTILSGARFAPSASAHTPVTRVTWTQDIGPIIQRRCAGCHRPGGFGPMSLLTYADARAAADDVRKEVQEGRMPLWPAARGFGDHANDRSLTLLEIGLITAWTEGGTPLGPTLHPADLPRPVKPDVVFATRQSAANAALGRHVLTPRLSRERWISGWEFRAANANAQRAVLSLESGQRIGSWVPPEGVISYPAGVGVRLPVGTRLVLDVNYRKASDKGTRQESDGGTVALYFSERPANALLHRALPCGSTTIQRAIDVLSIQADAAGAGDSVEVVTTRPDGSVEPLCLIPRFQPGYRPTLRLRTPVALPTGTVVDVRSSATGCGAEMEFIEYR